MNGVNHVTEISAGRIVAGALAFVVACAMCCACLAHAEPAYAVKTVNQKSYALVAYDTAHYKLVKNKKYATHVIKKRESNPVFSTKAHKYGTKKGNKKATLKTLIYMPVTYQKSGDMGNPQSANLTPDGRYLYVTYPKSGSKTLGRIIRYDIQKLLELGVDSGDMSVFVRACHSKCFNKELSDLDKELLSCMKVGPWCKIGHGNAFAYNPKDGCLWFIGKTSSVKTNLQRINMKSLKPNLKINFTMSNSEKGISNNLAFDNKGRVYFYSYSAANSAIPEGTIRIFQGKIKKNKKVTFELVGQGIRNSPTRNIQSMGYNPKSNRLYMVGNGVIMSVPVAKLGKMKKSDVHLTIFKGKREYEDITFDAEGNGYLLINGRPELMKISKGF